MISKDTIKRLEHLGKAKASYLAEEASQNLTKKYVSLIDLFYNTYTPKMYDRTYGLYDSFRKFNKNGKNVYMGGVIVSAEKMNDYEADLNPYEVFPNGRKILTGRREPITASDLLFTYVYNQLGTWHGGDMHGGFGVPATFNLYKEIHDYHEQLKNEYRKRCSV